MFGRLGACLIAQLPRLRALTVHNICIFGAGISCTAIPFCMDYTSMAVVAFIYGLCMGKIEKTKYLSYNKSCLLLEII